MQAAAADLRQGDEELPRTIAASISKLSSPVGAGCAALSLTLCHSFTRDILHFVISPFLTLTKLTENGFSFMASALLLSMR